MNVYSTHMYTYTDSMTTFLDLAVGIIIAQSQVYLIGHNILQM